MPIYKTINSEGGTEIFVWKIEESFDELSRGLILTENSRSRLEGMKSLLHQKGFLSVRQLLKHAGYQDKDLYYNEYGKPFLKVREKQNMTVLILVVRFKEGHQQLATILSFVIQNLTQHNHWQSKVKIQIIYTDGYRYRDL